LWLLAYPTTGPETLPELNRFEVKKGDEVRYDRSVFVNIESLCQYLLLLDAMGMQLRLALVIE
jgi:hypothetical protein